MKSLLYHLLGVLALSEIIHAERAHTSSHLSERVCVGSSVFLCICIFSHTENGKQVMCETARASALFALLSVYSA